MNWRRGNRPGGWYPRRGDVCLVSLDKLRPAVVLSSDSLNAHALDVCVLPISTSEHRAFSLRPKLKAGEGGLEHDSWVKCDQPTTIEKQIVLYPPLGRLPGSTMQTLAAAVRMALEL